VWINEEKWNIESIPDQVPLPRMKTIYLRRSYRLMKKRKSALSSDGNTSSSEENNNDDSDDCDSKENGSSNNSEHSGDGYGGDDNDTEDSDDDKDVEDSDDDKDVEDSDDDKDVEDSDDDNEAEDVELEGSKKQKERKPGKAKSIVREDELSLKVFNDLMVQREKGLEMPHDNWIAGQGNSQTLKCQCEKYGMLNKTVSICIDCFCKKIYTLCTKSIVVLPTDKRAAQIDPLAKETVAAYFSLITLQKSMHPLSRHLLSKQIEQEKKVRSSTVRLSTAEDEVVTHTIEYQEVCNRICYCANKARSNVKKTSEDYKMFQNAVRLACLRLGLGVAELKERRSTDGIPYTNHYGQQHCDGINTERIIKLCDGGSTADQDKHVKFYSETPAIKAKHKGDIQLKASVMLLIARWAKRRKGHYFNDVFNAVNVMADYCSLHPYEFITLRAWWYSDDPVKNSCKEYRVEYRRIEEKIKRPRYERFRLLHSTIERTYEELLSEESMLRNTTEYGHIVKPVEQDNRPRKRRQSQGNNLIMNLLSLQSSLSRFWKGTGDLHRSLVLVNNILIPHMKEPKYNKLVELWNFRIKTLVNMWRSCCRRRDLVMGQTDFVLAYPRAHDATRESLHALLDNIDTTLQTLDTQNHCSCGDEVMKYKQLLVDKKGTCSADDFSHNFWIVRLSILEEWNKFRPLVHERSDKKKKPTKKNAKATASSEIPENLFAVTREEQCKRDELLKGSLVACVLEDQALVNEKTNHNAEVGPGVMLGVGLGVGPGVGPEGPLLTVDTDDKFSFPTSGSQIHPPRLNNLKKRNVEYLLHVDGPGKDYVLCHNTADFYMANGLKKLEHKTCVDDARRRKFEPNRRKSVDIIWGDVPERCNKGDVMSVTRSGSSMFDDSFGGKIHQPNLLIQHMLDCEQVPPQTVGRRDRSLFSYRCEIGVGNDINDLTKACGLDKINSYHAEEDRCTRPLQGLQWSSVDAQCLHGIRDSFTQDPGRISDSDILS